MPPERPERIDAEYMLGQDDEPPIGHEKETNHIRSKIMAADRRLRTKYPWLKHQDMIGTGLWALGASWFFLNCFLYVKGILPAWLCIPLTAIALSIHHELEHDLIHKQYFPRSRWLQDLMLGTIWIFKASQELSPFVRRDLHLLHHKRSGQVDDVEERLLGLGVNNHILRILTAIFPTFSLIYILSIERETKWRLLRGSGWFSRERFVQHFETLLISSPMWLGYVLYVHPWLNAGKHLLSPPAQGWAHILMVTWLLPNVLRHACLALMSSYSHYYLANLPVERHGSGDITLQNQVLNHWLALPFQVFCFNFGAEHIIHHYVVSQPFYIRHLVRYEAWEAMRESGQVRMNDWQAIWQGGVRDKVQA